MNYKSNDAYNGNKLIAHSPFSDMTPSYINREGKLEVIGYESKSLLNPLIRGSKSHHQVENMKYDEDWNWLIPVVKNLVELKGESVTFHPDVMKSLDIETVFKEVVLFIQWYNKEQVEQEDANPSTKQVKT
jgi:hypothetical protein